MLYLAHLFESYLNVCHGCTITMSTLALLLMLVLVLLLLQLSPCNSLLKPLATTSKNLLVQVGKLKLSPIGFGTWSWGNEFLWNYKTEEDEELSKTFEFSIQSGVNWFDTADSYGTNGRSETLLGRFDKQKQNRKKAVFATKLAPFPWRVSGESMRLAAAESVRRLDRPAIDILQMHWRPYFLLPPLNDYLEKEYLRAFGRLVEEGKATQIGVSNYGPETLSKAAAIAMELKSPIYSNQVQFSLLSRFPIENGLDEVCAELGITPIGYSPLALGLLTDRYSVSANKFPSGPRGLLFKEKLPKIAGLLDVLRDIARQRKKTVAQVVLNWNMQKGFLVLAGVRTVAQARENLGALGWSLSPGEVTEIERAARRVPGGQLIQNSFQTL